MGVISLTDQPDLPLEEGELGLATDDSLLAPVAASHLPPPGENDCRVCGAQVGPDQDWCLECGAAVAEPRRIPGLATVALAGVFTLVLAGGAVAAGVAALNDTTPPRDTEVETVAEELPESPAVDDNLSSDPLSPDSGAVDDSLSPVEPLPAPAPAPTPSPTPEPAPEPVSLAGATKYDPDGREAAGAVEMGDPANAIAAKKFPSFKITLLEDDPGLYDAGIQVQLKAPKKVKKLTFTTTNNSTGFSFLVYGSKADVAPDDDQQMTLIGEVSRVKPTDDKKYEHKLTSKTTYKTIVIWFTKPPNKGKVTSMSQLKFFTD